MLDFRTLLAAAVLFVCVGTAPARDYPVAITGARVGLPPVDGSTNHITRFACWSPVYIDLEIAVAIHEPAELVIESADPDEITTSLAVPLNIAGIEGKLALADRGMLGYVRPAGVGEVTFTIRAKDGGKALSEPYRIRSLRPRDPLTYVVLSLGNRPAGFEFPKPPGVPPELTAGLRGGRLELATITDVAQLPDRWYGYESADLVVLHTSHAAEKLLNDLFSQGGSSHADPKRRALADWVRRGGRLVVAVGENAGGLSRWPGLGDLLPLNVSGTQDHDRLAMYWTAPETSQTRIMSGALLTKEGSRFKTARLVPKPERPARILIPPPERRAEKEEIIAGQWAYGLGRVTVVGFDLDQAPFAEFSHRAEFWDWVLRTGGANRASVGSEGKPKPGAGTLTEEEDELAVALRTHGDTFVGLPVVSFGWIAFLIVLYILLIGPIEYFFLKRVLGRLELTWITFPIIVATVCVAAYLSAYGLKGRDLKINKLDVVDIDPVSQGIYGTTWFTIFSPRIDDYTLAVTPGEGWSKEKGAFSAPLSWIGSPRGGRASLLRRHYQYHLDEAGFVDGLEKVPVQVWSTKSFMANWSAGIAATHFDPDPNDPVNRPLEHPRDPALSSGVTGTFVNRLPIPALTDCVAFYGGQAYPIPGGTILSGETVRVVFDSGVPASEWLKKEGKLDDLLMRTPSGTNRPGAAKAAGPQAGAATQLGPLPLLGLLFHESSLTYGEGVIPRNASLRRLDQSWRLSPDNLSEVIIVGRVTLPIGSAEETLCGPSSPSRLWIRGLPESGTRTPIPGSGRQETWVRIYLPVK